MGIANEALKEIAKVEAKHFKSLVFIADQGLINSELLEALKAITTECWKAECFEEQVEQAHKAIAKAEGGK